MKVDLTEPSPVKKVLAIEIDADEMAKETKTVLRGYASKANIPGFRQGKAPLSVIESRFKKEVHDDVRERVMSRSFREAAKEHELRPLGDPVVDEVKDEEGEPFRFTVSFEVLPELEAKNYKDIEVRRPSDAVGEADVDQALEELRQSRSQLTTQEDREAITGDVVSCDLKGTPDDEGEVFERERTMVEVCATGNPPTFNDKLEGVRAGAKLDFKVDYPKEYDTPELAGKSVRYEIVVHEVKIREVPDLDDEFAKDLGEFDDLAALRARVREDLVGRKKHEVDQQVSQAVLDKALIENPVVLPEVLVEDEIRHRMEDMVRRMYMQGIDPEKVELDWKQLREQQEEPARKSVHARMLLDSIARLEKVEVAAKEVEERMRHDAQSMGQKYDEFKKRLKERGGTEVVKSQIVRERSLDLLTAVANIQNEE
jgi:trigger factor